MKEPAAPALWHYTCEHSHRDIGDAGLLKPVGMLTNPKRFPDDLRWMSEFAWLTDQPKPHPAGLGLKLRSYSIITCDRTQVRYRLDPDDRGKAVWWPTAVRSLPGAARGLALADGAQPVTWWVVREPVRITLDVYEGGPTR